ncbi:hypothetical protein BpHYR1_020290 [Brachionus plicatilis]|uniref:Uncharacterized protein n=1 Tax=Brachionus plicatilis TaxID=10195 RepID=A0A3M7PA47_BRAPC|nr:hypothetical protein BpHYR1_020290 [Brachionus plicatilis]
MSTNRHFNIVQGGLNRNFSLKNERIYRINMMKAGDIKWKNCLQPTIVEPDKSQIYKIFF